MKREEAIKAVNTLFDDVEARGRKTMGVIMSVVHVGPDVSVLDDSAIIATPSFVTPLIGAAHRLAAQCNNLIDVHRTLDRVTYKNGEETRESLDLDGDAQDEPKAEDPESTVPY